MKKTTYLNKGNFEREHGGKHEYEFPSSADFFAAPTNLISGLSGVSGGRVLLGDKANLQAISLVNREAPLVQATDSHKNESFNQKFGKNLVSLRAKEAGKVSKVDSEEIVVGTHHYELYDHHGLGRKSFMQHTPVVKVGDAVKKGDLLATSNYSDAQGNLALGINLRTAIMPYRGANFEDAFVVTESGAKKLDAEQIMKFRVEKKFGVETNKNKFISIFPNKFSNEQLAKLDEDGVIKKGSHVKHGDPVLLSFSPKSLRSTDVQLGTFAKVAKNAYRESAETYDYEHDGEVVDVSKSGDLFTIGIKTRRSLQIGDKLSNFGGAKGVVGYIIPDAQAPVDHEGKPVDLILNSMSITSRVAPALAVAMGLGKYAQKIGKNVKMQHFTEGSAVQKTIDLLKKHKIEDMEELYDPVSGTHMKALVGPLYTNRLTHISEDKISDRGQGVAYSWDMQPTKTSEESAKRIGNLSTTALLAAGATSLLRDISTIKATKNDEYWRRLKLGLSTPAPKTPFIFDKFLSSLQGAGVKVDRQGDVYQILPQTNKDIDAITKGPIDNALTFRVKKDQLVPEKGGLFDSAKTGVMGDNYNHIDLNLSVPNPISEDYLRKLLHVTKKDYEDLIVSGKIDAKLKAIDVNAEMKKYQEYLRSGKRTERDNAVKVLSFLKALKANNIHPHDLMLNKIPVIPAKYRPIAMMGDMILPSEVNLLYKDLILNNGALKKLEHSPDELKNEVKLKQYHAVKAVYGLGEPITQKSKDKGVKGLLSSMLGIQGGSAKGSMFQSKIVNKPQDLVGRGVATGDAKLDLDEAGLPQSLVWKIYAPFVTRRLVQKGVPAVKAVEYVEKKNPLALQELHEELKHRPAIITRDPALHKFNLQAFYVKPHPSAKNTTISLNPLVFKGFGLDLDGDQTNAFVPVSEQARLETIDKLLPSRNLLSPRNFAPVHVPSNESALGLFQSSTENNKKTPKKYKSEADVIRDFHSGKLSVDDQVEIA